MAIKKRAAAKKQELSRYRWYRWKIKMIGVGTIINSAAIVGGGLVGHYAGKLFREDQQKALTVASGVSVLFIAVAGAMQGMLTIDGKSLVSGKSMLVVLCLALGTVIGEMIGIESWFERFGEWLKVKTGNIGINLVWGKMVRVANMLPAVLLAVLAAYLPWSF